MHLAKGIHAYNYSDISILDIIFRTFKIPKEYENETAFYDGASSNAWDILIFKGVSEIENGH
ncbi:MAG: hypothetical protein KAJ23_18455 [Maribacter sp.]|nr:hypothetical protein [Maribacter sp.]